MTLSTGARTNALIGIQTLIDTTIGGTPTSGSLDFYDINSAFIVSLPLAYPSMTIVNGVGTFVSTAPYLHGTVGVGYGATAFSWALNAHANIGGSPLNAVITGTCGDPAHSNADLIFNSLIWQDYDVITVSGFTITVPA
jgi:hypothetical protein